MQVTAAGAQLHDGAGLKAWADASVQVVGRLRTKQVRLSFLSDLASAALSCVLMSPQCK